MRAPVLPMEVDQVQGLVIDTVIAALARADLAAKDGRLSAEGRKAALAAIRAEAEARLASIDDPVKTPGWAKLRRQQAEHTAAVERFIQPPAERMPVIAQHMAHLRGLGRHEAAREVGMAVEQLRDATTLPEHTRQAAIDLLQAYRSSPGMGELSDELGGSADRVLRQALGGSDFRRGDDLAIAQQHVGQLRAQAVAELNALDDQ